MTWADMAKKYPEYREDMTKDRERDSVKDCFDCYEKEGFAENLMLYLILIKSIMERNLQSLDVLRKMIQT